ncbi:rhodanese-like domain-containing protein [Oharaeibacter diazotrophicus]|uniref:Rhodanese-related sulfurtransferase n=1 Tax=Oharaeibacter diazotrophicus TaxID=1920512 RepID=A0A4R6R8Z9_9HYPH|nr:rhodanese-like domain-containing protein [Oharaeibacter diazotrophicus]TDP82422.1 rhodanese-related sulfurtransferase [Oharaeibacter diazotrophicus]BBE72815.1 putative adenylyltransferase/sulfurtransferase MoeZ [Pleomorphomonas sp. SM30]GLS76853.1 sulfurtransferase [Oharaeibacter diazotrophicus]
MFGFGTRTTVKTLSPPEVRDLLDRGAITLVDVREAGEWASGRIPGAIHAPLSRLRELAPGIPTDKPVVFYCLSGGRSAQAIAACAAGGLSRYDTHMAGGISSWRAHGLPLTR